MGGCAVVFNNPFDSFHNTVAEAKEEREQLDRLLTISTPRERLLVAVVALLLIALVAWLFLGTVARDLAVDGIVVAPGEGPGGDGRSVQALVWVENGVAPDIEAGMPAAIELGMTDGVADTLDGEIVTTAAVPLSEGPAAFASAMSVSVLRLDIVLDESHDLASLAGRECRIFIELGSQSPVAFLRMRQS